MALCTYCDFRVDIVAACGGSNCDAVCCPLHLSDTSLCPECEAEEAKRVDCPPLSAELMALLLSGVVLR